MHVSVRAPLAFGRSLRTVSPSRPTLWRGGSSRTAWSTWRGTAWSAIPCTTRSAAVRALYHLAFAAWNAPPARVACQCCKAPVCIARVVAQGCSSILPAQLLDMSTGWLLGRSASLVVVEADRRRDCCWCAGVPQHWRCALHSACPAGEVVRLRRRALRALPGAPASHLQGGTMIPVHETTQAITLAGSTIE